MGAVARAESDAKSDRNKRAALQAAQQGRWHGGRRCYGYTADGAEIVPEEAVEIRRLAKAIVSGESLHALAKDLRARGVPTSTGGEWRYQTLRDLLRRPRLAGLSGYRGQVVGRGNWPAILDEDTHRAIRALLDDPTRRKMTSNKVKWLLSHLAECGVCRRPLTTSGTANGRMIYRCETHIARSAEQLDAFVTELVIARLS
ncbi:MAG TPA: recombinase family protein, partial [Mycobacteriales bacterium]|nr:recombinase family protein [Mycobacteriales bacterium]